MQDNELIWENYINANWGYSNKDYPSNEKYGNIPTSKTSYYQKGHCPASPPGQASTYSISQEQEEKEFKVLPYKFWVIGDCTTEDDKKILACVVSNNINKPSQSESISKFVYNMFLRAARKHKLYLDPIERQRIVEYKISPEMYDKKGIVKLVLSQPEFRPTQQIKFFKGENGDDITDNLKKLINNYINTKGDLNQMELNYE